MALTRHQQLLLKKILVKLSQELGYTQTSLNFDVGKEIDDNSNAIAAVAADVSALTGQESGDTADLLADILANSIELRYVLASVQGVHAGNDVALDGASNLAGGESQGAVNGFANQLKNYMSSHMVSVGSPTLDGRHLNEDSTNALTLVAVPDASGLPSCIALVVALKDALNAHKTQEDVHFHDDTSGDLTLTISPPTTKDECITDLQQLFGAFTNHFSAITDENLESLIDDLSDGLAQTLSDAKDYADGVGTSTLAAAEAYADGLGAAPTGLAKRTVTLKSGTRSKLQPSVAHAGSAIDTILTLDTKGTGGNVVYLSTVGDAAVSASINVAGNDITVHYKDGVTTVAEFEALFPVSVTFGEVSVLNSGTQLSTLNDPADTMTSVPFSGGVNGDLSDTNGDEAQSFSIGAALPANAIVLGHEVLLTTQFTGGGASACTVSLGGTTVGSICGGFDVKTSTAPARYSPGFSDAPGTHLTGVYSSETLQAVFTPTGGPLYDLDAGQLTATVWYTVLA